MLKADIIFADIQTRNQVKAINGLAKKVNTPVIGLYFSTRLDAAYFHKLGSHFKAHLIGFSQTTSLLNLDINTAFNKLKEHLTKGDI